MYRERGSLGLFITLVPQVLKFFLFFGLTTLGTFTEFRWFIKLSVQTFQPLILIYKSCNLVCHHWGCTSIYRLLYFPFRCLHHLPGGPGGWIRGWKKWVSLVHNSPATYWKISGTTEKIINIFFSIANVFYI